MRVGALALKILLGLVIAGLVASYWIDDLVVRSYRNRGVAHTPAALRTIVSAQKDFRANDRDGNGRADYWRADIAGLYGCVPQGSTDAIKLIEISIAGADDRPASDVSTYVTRSPKSDYWFRALRFADETTLSPDRFAAHAFPADPEGKAMHIVSQDEVLWSRPAVAGGVDVFPADPAAAGWQKTP